MNFIYIMVMYFLAITSNSPIDDYLKTEFQKGNLNGNVLVLSKGEVAFKGSYGFADGSKLKLLNSNHKFNIGSIYKEFPAVGIMQLHEEGLVDLDLPISTYLKGFPDWADSISITNLLRYSAGLPQVPWNNLFGSAEVPNDSILYNVIMSVDNLEFEPGTDYLYSNMCPLLLIKIIENKSQLTFNQYLHSKILDPLELVEIEVKGIYPYSNREKMAIPFNSDFEEDNYRIAVSSLLFTATTNAIQKWFSALDDYKIISESSYRFLASSHGNNAEYESPLGSVVWKEGKLFSHMHHGSTANYECIAKHYKEEDLSILIFTNQKNANVHEILNEIHRLSKE